MNNLLKLIEIIIWPSTVLALAFTFRTETRSLLSRLIMLKYKDWEAEFERTISKAESITPPQELIHNSVRERLERLAEISPRAAILEAWIEFEQALSSLAEAHRVDTMSPLHVIRELEKRQIISPQLAESFHGLRKLRNEAVHIPDFAIDEKQAERYISLATGMGLLLRNADDNQSQSDQNGKYSR